MSDWDICRFDGLDVGADLTTALLEEAGKLAADMVSPLRRVGDQQPARCSNGAVTIPPGYGDAIKALGEGGWVGFRLRHLTEAKVYPSSTVRPPAKCGIQPIWRSRWNPLSTGAALAISAHASPELKDKYLPNINAGIWSGTMNLTESGAGSDLGPMKTRASW